MSIPESFEFDNSGEVVRHPWLRRYFLSAVILLVALLSFGIGRLTSQVPPGVRIEMDEALTSNTKGDSLVIGHSDISTLPAGAVTASSQGTRYYYSHCANTISEKNRVTFASAALAEAAGYTLAKNCSSK